MAESDENVAEEDEIDLGAETLLPSDQEVTGPEGAEGAAGPSGPGAIRRAVRWTLRWHPLFFLGAALAMAAYAYMVYPEPAAQTVPPAELLYNDGLDRLYRVINPDLPLVAATPADEALAARNALLNLFVFHRPDLRNYPQFINPHLLLAEANRILAEFNPGMADKYYADARDAYADAALWETREDDARNLAIYVNANFLDGRAPLAPNDPAGMGADAMRFFEENDEEIALRRRRRQEYIRYRQAETEVNLGRPEMARPVLEDIQQLVENRRRDEIRRALVDDVGADDVPRRAFELGPDEYRHLEYLLARVYDGLQMLEQAKARYLRFLASGQTGRYHALVVERLADINLSDGEVYHRVNPVRAEEAYQAAVGYYRMLAESPSSTSEQRDAATLGLANANARLADLAPGGERTGVDELSAVGRTLRGWLEGFSGQTLPRRTLGLPLAVGETLAKPELIVPGPFSLPTAVSGSLMAMAGGEMETPYEKSRQYHTLALENYDRVAASRAGSEDGNRAAVLAAWESWKLGQKADTEARFEKMLDPLSDPDLTLAARLGLATVALDRGDLDRSQMLILGGYGHSQPLWFTPTDADWPRLAARLGNPGNRAAPNPWLRVWETLPAEGTEIAAYAASGRQIDDEYVNRFLRSLNTMLRRRDFYLPEYFPPRDRNRYLEYLLSLNPELLTPGDVLWRNRMLMEEAWPYDLSQKGSRNNVGFEPFPPGRELTPGGLVEEAQVSGLLTELARRWTATATETPEREERLRRLLEGNAAYRAALDRYHGEPGEILFELAQNYERLAEIREVQGDHREALSLTAAAARSYLDVSLRAQGTPREMDALLASGDAFFRAGLLERTVESQQRFLDRFGYSATPGSESAMAVVRAENLLGRAYWFLGDVPRALESFGRNISRRTPDRYKSVYYIGRVMMEDGMARDDPALLGDPDYPLPELDRNGDPLITSALQAFNWLRQSPGINPAARAWRWSTFDLARLEYLMAERARRETPTTAAGQEAPEGGQNAVQPWLAPYETARASLTEALDRYPLRRNGGIGVSVRVEPEDYADVMASRFETEYMLANTLLLLADGRRDETLAALARTHLNNLADRGRYADALFDVSLDRFQLNSAVIREEVEGGNWDRNQPLPRTRLGDDEGPTHSPWAMREMLRNAMQLLAGEYYRAGDLAAARNEPAESAGFYRLAYEAYQRLYDRFGFAYGSLAMVGMGDSLAKLGRPEDAANHYRMARNIAEMMPEDTRPDGLLDIGPAFWGSQAESRLADQQTGYGVP